MNWLSGLLYNILFLTLINQIHCDYYSSITGLEHLLQLEDFYIEALEKHLTELEVLNNEFESLFNEINLHHAKIGNDTDDYFAQPMNAVKIVNRFVVDWKQLEDITEHMQNLKVFNESSIPNVNFLLPNEQDVNGAARGMSRLQAIYKLEAVDIAKGYLKGKKFSSKLTAYECFVLGRRLYDAENFEHASEWLIEALHKIENIEKLGLKQQKTANGKSFINSNIYPHINKTKVLEYLTDALHGAGNSMLAIKMNAALLAIDASNEQGLANEVKFQKASRSIRHKRLLDKPRPNMGMKEIYNQVCNGELQQTPREKHDLHCRYTTKDISYYILGPLKMEELNLDPFVAFYYDVISDNEIDQIITTSLETITRSRIGTPQEHREDDVRISKNAWLDLKQHRFLDKLSQRLEDITGLSLVTSEELQVVNYGIGGFYGPHYDFSDDPARDYGGDGNRILTAMLYINDVEMGGATAFPILRLAVPPIRRGLLVWYNIHKSTEPDHRTLHSGCPVLKGSKWISNIWFHAVGQEFRRPCALEPDDEISKPYKDYEIFFYDEQK